MGKDTLIEWCDSTVNPTSGCDGCELWNRKAGVQACYAGAIHERFSPTRAYPGPFEQVDLQPGRMAQAARWPDLAGERRPDKPWLDGMPRMIFVGDMGDIFSKAVPFEYLRDEVMAAAESGPGKRHVWLWLTKQAGRLAEFAKWLDRPWPENVWPGVSVTSEATLSRVETLCRVPGAVRFVSMEPLRELVDLDGYEAGCCTECRGGGETYGHYFSDTGCATCERCGGTGEDDSNLGVGWAIVGGASGPDAWPFNVAWAERLVRYANMPVFVKQVGSRPFHDATLGTRYDDHTYMKLRDAKGGDWSEWPEAIRTRQVPAIGGGA